MNEYAHAKTYRDKHQTSSKFEKIENSKKSALPVTVCRYMEKTSSRRLQATGIIFTFSDDFHIVELENENREENDDVSQ